MVSHFEQRIYINDRRIELPWRRRSGFSALEEEYAPPKNSKTLYEDCIKSVQLEFGKYSKKFSVFKKLIQDCKEQRITVQEMDLTTDKLLFKDHPKLYRSFCNAVVPCLYPVSTRVEVDKANQFIRSIESAFPNNLKRCDIAQYLIVKFQCGTLSLQDMTVKMLKLMENRDDLIEVYIKFVPRAEHVIASIISRRRFGSYLPFILIIVAFGIGFHMLKN